MFFLKELPSRQILESYHDRFPEMNVGAVESALLLMRRASHLIRALDAYFATHDFSQLRFLICIVIDREPNAEGLTASQIIEKLDVSKPVMTRTVQSLVSAGLVVFTEHEWDRRAKVVALTPEGRDRINSILPGYYALIERFMAEEETDDE